MNSNIEMHVIKRSGKVVPVLFDKILIQYNKYPEITRDRLYIEAMENILEEINGKVIVDPDLENFLPFMNVEPKGSR